MILKSRYKITTTRLNVSLKNNIFQNQLEIKEKKPKEALERFENVVMMEESSDRFKW